MPYFRSMYYWSKGNLLLRNLYPNWHWKVKTKEKKIYLTFDDGPHPEITPWVLQQLQQYNAKATFFCIGKNVAAYPAVYERILDEGHQTGNHTMHHMNGWKSATAAYFTDILEAGKYIQGKLFRPPYGKLTRFQGKALRQAGYEVVMWSILSGDFDRNLAPEKCWEMVQENVGNGAIIVYHDSDKAWDRLSYSLPRLLEKFSHMGYTFASLDMDSFK